MKKNDIQIKFQISDVDAFLEKLKKDSKDNIEEDNNKDNE